MLTVEAEGLIHTKILDHGQIATCYRKYQFVGPKIINAITTSKYSNT